MRPDSLRERIEQDLRHGRFALRACILNHRPSEEDIRAVVSEVAGAEREICLGLWILLRDESSWNDIHMTSQ